MGNRNQQQEFKDLANYFKKQKDRKGDRPGASGAEKRADSENLDSGDKKAAALAKLRKYLECKQYLNTMREQRSEYASAFVKGTFKWIEDEEVYRDFVDEKAQILVSNSLEEVFLPSLPWKREFPVQASARMRHSREWL
jgi:hypothetical protein